MQRFGFTDRFLTTGQVSSEIEWVTYVSIQTVPRRLLKIGIYARKKVN